MQQYTGQHCRPNLHSSVGLIAEQTVTNYKKNPWTGPRFEILSDLHKGRIISYFQH